MERDAYLKAAILSFGKGHAAEALAAFEQHGHLHEVIGVKETVMGRIRLLVDDGLLSPKTPGGSQAYILDPLVFAPENRLPDLAGDPRRPKH